VVNINKKSFQKRVLELTARIPKGRVTTYSEIARKLNTRAYRSVGQALKRNPHAPEIPCHRVVRSDGLPGGYSQGVKKKSELLKKEGIEIRNGRIDLGKYLFRF
jgi:methylated-DNA-[protein]-cysteine S-methyltransferase